MEGRPVAGAKFASEDERFWSKVDQCGPDECWPWMAAVGRTGYGRFAHSDASKKGGTRHEYAHRVAYRLAHGLALGAMPQVVRHTCDNPPCCNPGHLLPGTQSENNHDSVSRGRFNRKARGRKGELGNSKLKERDVLAIRASAESAKTLAATYGVTREAIYHVRNRKTWTHI